MKNLLFIGFGNQTSAWAQNLRDSGWDVAVGTRDLGSSFQKSEMLGFKTSLISKEVLSLAKNIALLTPDDTHHEFLEQNATLLAEGTRIILAHGYSMVRHDLSKKYPHLRFVLYAPKAIAAELRTQYTLKGKLGAVYSLDEVPSSETLEHDQWCLALTYGLGINLGPYKTTFKHEMEADLLSEQGVLCSLIPYTAKMMFEMMLKRGIEPELAFFESWYELKLIINAMVEKGPAAFYDLISPNALIGSEVGRDKLMTQDFQARLEDLFDDIQSAKFLDYTESINVPELRKTIKDRWLESSLEKTQKRILGGENK